MPLPSEGHKDPAYLLEGSILTIATHPTVDTVMSELPGFGPAMVFIYTVELGDRIGFQWGKPRSHGSYDGRQRPYRHSDEFPSRQETHINQTIQPTIDEYQ